MGWVVAIVLVAGCGRVGFDPLDDGGTARRCAFRDVNVGRRTTCAIDADGAVWCFGVNEAGEAAPGDPAVRVLQPAKIPLPGPATQVTLGRLFACALLDDRTVWCWGSGTEGQLGNGVVGSVPSPEQVMIGDDAIEIGASSRSMCARRKSDSSITCWGDNRFGEVGNGMSSLPQVAPTAVPATAGTQQLAMGHRHNCIVNAAGQAVCWGKNDQGQLADVRVPSRPALQPVLGLDPVRRVATAGNKSCVIEIDGDVKCWEPTSAAISATVRTLTAWCPCSCRSPVPSTSGWRRKEAACCARTERSLAGAGRRSATVCSSMRRRCVPGF